jgi:hypothetical protein
MTNHNDGLKLSRRVTFLGPDPDALNKEMIFK